MKLIEQKLPRRVMLKWLEEEEKEEGDRFEKLFTFLKSERKRLERLLRNSFAPERTQHQEQKKRKSVNNATKAQPEEYEKVTNKCLIHENSSHFTRKCKLFLSKPVSERLKIVNENKACNFCLSVNHIGKECPWKSSGNLVVLMVVLYTIRVFYI